MIRKHPDVCAVALLALLWVGGESVQSFTVPMAEFQVRTLSLPDEPVPTRLCRVISALLLRF
jgi:hypothetical protein